MANIGYGTVLVGSVGATVATVWHALSTKKQFYPAMVHIANSNLSSMVRLASTGCVAGTPRSPVSLCPCSRDHGPMALQVLYFQIAVLGLGLVRLFQLVFFGRLRASEREHQVANTWISVTETLLAMTIFRDEFNAFFVALFGFLLACKSFHWLTQDRVEFVRLHPILSYPPPSSSPENSFVCDGLTSASFSCVKQGSCSARALTRRNPPWLTHTHTFPSVAHLAG